MKKQTLGMLLIAISLSLTLSPSLCLAKKTDTKAKESASAPLELADLNSVESLTRFMTYYYLHPQPELLVPALMLADKLGLLNGGSSAPLQAFSSCVFAQNPDKVKEWFTQLASMSDVGRTSVLTAIWWSNTKEGKELLETISQQLPEKAKVEFVKQIASQAPEIDKMEIESPDVLDMLWGCFCATGDEKYVKRLISTLSWGKSDSKDLPKMLIASAARWSLASNMEQHEKVKAICTSMATQDTEAKPYLEKLLAEVNARLDKKDGSSESEKKKSAKTTDGNVN